MTFSQELLTLSTPPLLEVIRKGQALMIPLIILFCLSLTIILDRTFFWLEWMVRMRRERRLLNAYQKQGHPSGLRGFLGDRMKGNRFLSAVRKSIYLQVLLKVEDSPGRNALWEDVMDGIVSRSERFLSFLALVATLGTSFGLLGTVIGV
jgi:biopolymer transport protein ExbB/TolQ